MIRGLDIRKGFIIGKGDLSDTHPDSSFLAGKGIPLLVPLLSLGLYQNYRFPGLVRLSPFFVLTFSAGSKIFRTPRWHLFLASWGASLTFLASLSPSLFDGVILLDETLFLTGF